MLRTYLSEEDKGMLSSNCDIESMRSDLKKSFEASGKVVIDFTGVRSVSPSFAYECFGKMYDTKDNLEKLLGNIEVRNDERNLFQKVEKAIQRRIMVLS